MGARGPRSAAGAPEGPARPRACTPPRAWGAAIAFAALAPTAILTVLFPEGGTEPFVSSSFWPAMAALAILAVALPTRERELRVATALYAVATLATFVLATPLGGNVTRLGALLAGPTVAGAVLAARGRDGRIVLAALAAAAAVLAGVAARCTTSGAHRRRSLHRRRLPRAAHPIPRQPPRHVRVEIPFTANHWEAAYVAPHIRSRAAGSASLIASEAELFYDGTLSPATYRAWLDARAVAYVALPDAKLDYSAHDEARLIRAPPDLPATGLARRPLAGVRGAQARAARHRRSAHDRPRHRRLHDPCPPRAATRSSRCTTRGGGRHGGKACVRAGPGDMTRVTSCGPGT